MFQLPLVWRVSFPTADGGASPDGSSKRPRRRTSHSAKFLKIWFEQSPLGRAMQFNRPANGGSIGLCVIGGRDTNLRHQTAGSTSAEGTQDGRRLSILPGAPFSFHSYPTPERALYWHVPRPFAFAVLGQVSAFHKGLQVLLDSVSVCSRELIVQSIACKKVHLSSLLRKQPRHPA